MTLLKTTFEIVSNTLLAFGIDYLSPTLIVKFIKGECTNPELILRALLDLVLFFHGLSLQKRKTFLTRTYTLADLVFFLESDLQSVGFPFILVKSLKNLNSYEALNQSAFVAAIFYLLSIDGHFLRFLAEKYSLTSESDILRVKQGYSEPSLYFAITNVAELSNEAYYLLPHYKATKLSAPYYKAALILQTYYCTLETLFGQLQTGRRYPSYTRFTGIFYCFDFCAEPLFYIDEAAPQIDFTELNLRLAAQLGKYEMLLSNVRKNLTAKMEVLGYFNKRKQ